MFAGDVKEGTKGFAVLYEACSYLWQKRNDFELIATGEPVDVCDGFTRFIGWQSQTDLPNEMALADVIVCPTIAQEGLGRTAVEAMGVGRPVVASRLGGLPYTVTDGVTGLLCEPNNVIDLANRIEQLMDSPELREKLGKNGRARFERDFIWDVIINRHYRPLFSRRPSSLCLPS